MEGTEFNFLLTDLYRDCAVVLSLREKVNGLMLYFEALREIENSFIFRVYSFSNWLTIARFFFNSLIEGDKSHEHLQFVMSLLTKCFHLRYLTCLHTT